MHSARDRIEYEPWLEELETVADRLELTTEARSCAADLFLADVPDADRSKRAVLAASLYAGSLVAGDGPLRAQSPTLPMSPDCRSSPAGRNCSSRPGSNRPLVALSYNHRFPAQWWTDSA